MNPLFTTITEKEFAQNFEFIISLVQRGNSFYVQTNDSKLVALIPVNDPIAQSIMQSKDIQDQVEEALKDFSET